LYTDLEEREGLEMRQVHVDWDLTAIWHINFETFHQKVGIKVCYIMIFLC